jgi:hypothetical protein
MSFDSTTIGDKAADIGTDQMALAASSLSADASEKEVREAVAKIVSKMLDELPTVITWFIDESWAAKLVARVVDALGKTILDWLR